MSFLNYWLILDRKVQRWMQMTTTTMMRWLESLLKPRKRNKKSQQKGLERHRNIWPSMSVHGFWVPVLFKSGNFFLVFIFVKLRFCSSEWFLVNVLTWCLVIWLMKYECTCHGWVGRGDWPAWGTINFGLLNWCLISHNVCCIWVCLKGYWKLCLPNLLC